MALAPAGVVMARAQGSRLPFADLPARVLAWAEQQLGGRIATAADQIGGMSPGPAARLVTTTGRTAFLKAVGAELNEHTPELFRHEIAVLQVLPPSPHRAPLIAAYDDGAWVGMLLDDIEGRNPDWTRPGEMEAVRTAVKKQVAELTPVPPGLELRAWRDNVLRWAAAWDELAGDFAFALPAWATDHAQELAERVHRLVDVADGDTLLHYDLRDDNILLRPDGTVVFVDWGMSSRGPAWVDPVVLALEWAELAIFDEIVAADAPGHDQETTDLMLGIGGYLARTSLNEPPPGLPTLPAFRARESIRFLAGAHRRLRSCQ